VAGEGVLGDVWECAIALALCGVACSKGHALDPGETSIDMVHFIHPHELYVGTDHGVDKFRLVHRGLRRSLLRQLQREQAGLSGILFNQAGDVNYGIASYARPGAAPPC
jgi:hypothetical protein